MSPRLHESEAVRQSIAEAREAIARAAARKARPPARPLDRPRVETDALTYHDLYGKEPDAQPRDDARGDESDLPS